jgi:hypothetical protein
VPFSFLLSRPVVLCALGLLNDIRGGCTWRRGYTRLQRFSSEIVLAGGSESEVFKKSGGGSMMR